MRRPGLWTRLLSTQCANRIDCGCAPRGNQRSDERDEEQHRDRATEDERVVYWNPAARAMPL